MNELGGNKQALQILIVEDNTSDAKLIVLRLQQAGFHFDWQCVQIEPDYLAALDALPDLVLADWNLPQFSGSQALRLLRERGVNIPFIVVSGAIGEEAAIDCVHQGANDYVLKDNLARLAPAVRRAIEIKQLRDERIKARINLLRKSAMYSVLSSINKAIIHVDSRQSLFSTICDIVLRLGGFKLAWIGGVDAATQQVLPLAIAGAATDYPASIVVHASAELPTGQGPTGVAIRENRTVVCNDYFADTRTRPWHAAAARYGLSSNISLPLRGGGFCGALMAYAGEKDFFDGDVVTLFEEVALDISFALQKLQDDEERRAVESRLRLHALVFNQSSEAMAISDADNNIVMVNRAFLELTGYQPDEVLGKNPRMLQSGRHDSDFYRQMWTTLLQCGMWQGEIWNRRKNGDIYPEWATINLVRDEQGNIVNFFAISSDLTQHRAQLELQRLQRFDALTNLPNRMLLQDRVTEAIGHARLHQRYVALFYINLDHFRFVNESIGHAAGDQVLRTLAQRFSETVHEAGTVSRLSGDTFVVMLDDLNEIGAVDGIAATLLRESAKQIAVGDTEVMLSACIGIAFFPDDGDSFDTLLQNADTALAKAREYGRNNYSYFTQDLNDRARKTLAIASELRKALDQGWFVLHYQPLIDTSNGEVTAVEALIRMHHPERGLLQPGEFIHVAEETGMIVPIGAWVMGEACRQLKHWHQAGHDRLTMAINLSPFQFTDPRLFESIQTVLHNEGVDPHLIELEFTESAIMHNVGATLSVMKRLKDMGVRLSIDDFGTGYSSLNYLKQFSIDRIKIDQSFVRNLTTDPNDASIVQAILAMSRALGVTTVAEGVETEAQAGYLRSLHCNGLQGYYLARPGPADEIGKLLGSKHMVDRSAPTRTLLVVDDEENVLNALKRLLRSEGYRVITATSGNEALELLGKNDVGVIISDQRMPGMNGTELLRRVRTMYPNTVRIILSGYSEITTITDAINKGEIYRYVSKPWENEELISLLREAFVRNEQSLTPGP